jgi:membrane-bound lytic murein transglycosylase D
MKKNNTIGLVLLAFAFLIFGEVFGQVPQVPSEMRFADLTIKINEQARREIQADVDALYRNASYFQVKAERVNLYLPIVERELRAAGVPTDFKYLAIQESSLIADAVSTSNAVGFWQFKQGTAEEVSLRVDSQVDERKNIVASSQGAARYLKKHNAQFNNWMCALVSYQMGLGGAKAYFGTQYNGKKVVEVDRNFHWYFKKFLAHMVAFEAPTVMLASNSGFLEEVQVQGPTTLKALAPRLGVTEAHLKEYNKWSLRGNVPDDRPYSILYIRQGAQKSVPAIASSTQTQASETTYSPPARYTSSPPANPYPKITGNTQNSTQPNQIKANDLNAIKAAQNTRQENLAQEVGLKEGKFRRINDLGKNEKVQAGQFYYTEPKRSKAEAETHVVKPGETLWSISQMYGIKLSALKAKNRIREDRDLKAGMILNLQDFRPRNEPIPMVPANEYRRIVAGEETSPPSKSMTPKTEAAQNPSTPSTSTTERNANRVIHTVVQGETLFRLSQLYGVSVDDIKKWNNLSDNNIRIGQKITILKP